jgi:hypothetical protein
MIEATVLNYLKEALTVPVRMEVPENPPRRYVVLEKTGSSRMNRLNTATIAAQSYAESLVEAAKLNEEVKAAIDNMIELDAISACRLNSDYNFTNTQTKDYRYQCVYVITYLEV